MGLGMWAVFADRHRRWMILLALVSTFAGMGLVIDRPKGTIFEWLAVPLLAAGGTGIALAAWPRTAGGFHIPTSPPGRALRRLAIRGRLVPLLPRSRGRNCPAQPGGHLHRLRHP